MPMMHAIAIDNISFNVIANYAALDEHNVRLDTGGDLAERSVRMGIEANGKVAQSAVGECHRVAVDDDGYVTPGRTRFV